MHRYNGDYDSSLLLQKFLCSTLIVHCYVLPMVLFTVISASCLTSAVMLKVAADLAALTGRRENFGPKTADVSVTMQQDEWKPPQGQRGDGKTSLNDKLGY